MHTLTVVCAGSLTYSHWEPGGEYSKTIVVKNVQVKTIKLRYRPPHNGVFVPARSGRSSGRGDVITLTAGNSFSLPVLFRPSSKAPLEDEIVFVNASSKESGNVLFSVPLRAAVPRPKLAFVERVDFGIVCIHTTARYELTIANKSTLPTTWQLDVPPGFTATPACGALDAKAKTCVLLEFSPCRVGPHTGEATLKYDAGELRTSTIKLMGNSKLPFVSVRTGSVSGLVDFGDVPRAQVSG